MRTSIFKTFILIISLKCIVSWRTFEFHFQNIECSQKSKIASFINCSLSNLPKEQKGLCFSSQISQTIKKPKLDILIETSRPHQQNFVLANLTRIDGCRFIESRGILNIVEIIRKEIEKFSDLPKKCPIAKHSKVSVKDLVLDPNNFPPYVPETDFVVNVRLWEDIKAVFEVIVKGTVTARDRRIRMSTNKSSNRTRI